jgi:hypothetical protein
MAVHAKRDANIGAISLYMHMYVTLRGPQCLFNIILNKIIIVQIIEIQWN